MLVPLFVLEVDNVPVVDTLIVLEFDGVNVVVAVVLDDLEEMPELLDNIDGRGVILIAELREPVTVGRLLIDNTDDEVPVRDALILLDWLGLAVPVRDIPAEDEVLGDADELRVVVDDLEAIDEDDAVWEAAVVREPVGLIEELWDTAVDLDDVELTELDFDILDENVNKAEAVDDWLVRAELLLVLELVVVLDADVDPLDVLDDVVVYDVNEELDWLLEEVLDRVLVEENMADFVESADWMGSSDILADFVAVGVRDADRDEEAVNVENVENAFAPANSLCWYWMLTDDWLGGVVATSPKLSRRIRNRILLYIIYIKDLDGSASKPTLI